MRLNWLAQASLWNLGLGNKKRRQSYLFEEAVAAFALCASPCSDAGK
jgi:hypothetical protein